METVIFMLYLLSSRLIFFSFDNREFFLLIIIGIFILPFYKTFMRIVQINDSYITKVENLKVVVTTCDILSLSKFLCL